MSEPLKMDQPHWLDAVLVIGVLAIVAGVFYGLVVLNIPDKNLPILAGSLGVLIGTVIGGYAGFRWGASQSTKKDPPATPGTVTATMTATAETTPEV